MLSGMAQISEPPRDGLELSSESRSPAAVRTNLQVSADCASVSASCSSESLNQMSACRSIKRLTASSSEVMQHGPVPDAIHAVYIRCTIQEKPTSGPVTISCCCNPGRISCSCREHCRCPLWLQQEGLVPVAEGVHLSGMRMQSPETAHPTRKDALSC